jgi:GntR family transcriptional regulator
MDGMPEDRWMPAYVKIAENIRHQITSGQLAGGDKLPSERDLCDQWNVSTITVRKALEVLRSEGLIYGVRGKGTFVRKAEPLRRIAPQRYWRPHTTATYNREAADANRSVHVQHHAHHATAPADIAARLRIKEGAPVQRITYLIKMDDQPVSSSVCWEPLQLTGGTSIEHPHEGPMAGAGIVPRFDSIGIHVDGIREVLNIRWPLPEEAETLDIPPGVSVVSIEQTFRAGETIVQTADIIFATDRYTLEYDMEIR